MTIEELLNNEALMKDLASSQTLEEAQDKLDENDVNVDYNDLVTAFEYASKNVDGDLSEEDLENVSGGAARVASVVTVCKVAPTLRLPKLKSGKSPELRGPIVKC